MDKNLHNGEIKLSSNTDVTFELNPEYFRKFLLNFLTKCDQKFWLHKEWDPDELMDIYDADPESFLKDLQKDPHE